MTDLENVVNCFLLSKEHCIVPVKYEPQKWLKVYDKEEDYRPATIINITRDPNEEVAIEIKYTDNDETRCYLICDDVINDLPINDGNLDYHYSTSGWFDYYFMTENRMNKYRNKVWPKMFGTPDDVYLEYNKTIDPTHADYELIWYDGFNRRHEYMVTLSREDINELINDKETFINELTDSICILGLWTQPTKGEDGDNK